METFDAACPDDHVIVVSSGSYGLMRDTRCVMTENRKYIGCSVDVTSYMDSVCTGVQRCSVRAADQRLMAASTCQPGLIPYLETSYTCMKGKRVYLMNFDTSLP